MPVLPNIELKSFPITAIKSIDAKLGVAEMIVSVFNNVDQGKERILPGYFTKSIATRRAKGVWMHDWTQPIAKTLEAKELLPGDALLPERIRDLGGLYVKGAFNLDTQRGRESFSDIEKEIVDEFSIGILTTNRRAATDVSGVIDLVEGEWYEWSPVLFGMNELTQTIGVKSREFFESAHAATAYAGTAHRNLPIVQTPAVQAPAVQFKSVFLGDYLERNMTLAAIEEMWYAMWWKIYEAFYFGPTDKPVGEIISEIEPAFGEFASIGTRVIKAILSGTGAENAQSAAKWIKDNVLGVQTKSRNSSRLTLEQETELMSMGAERFVGRVKHLLAIQTKEGRTYSTETINRLRTAVGAIKDGTGILDEMITKADGEPPEKDTGTETSGDGLEQKIDDKTMSGGSAIEGSADEGATVEDGTRTSTSVNDPGTQLYLETIHNMVAIAAP